MLRGCGGATQIELSQRDSRLFDLHESCCSNDEVEIAFLMEERMEDITNVS